MMHLTQSFARIWRADAQSVSVANTIANKMTLVAGFCGTQLDAGFCDTQLLLHIIACYLHPPKRF